MEDKEDPDTSTRCICSMYEAKARSSKMFEKAGFWTTHQRFSSCRANTPKLPLINQNTYQKYLVRRADDRANILSLSR